jgi:hypothetical protein
MSVRNFSASTQRSYVYHVWKFSEFFGKRLRTADDEDVRAYQSSIGTWEEGLQTKMKWQPAFGTI